MNAQDKSNLPVSSELSTRRGGIWEHRVYLQSNLDNGIWVSTIYNDHGANHLETLVYAHVPNFLGVLDLRQPDWTPAEIRKLISLDTPKPPAFETYLYRTVVGARSGHQRAVELWQTAKILKPRPTRRKLKELR